MVLTHTPTVGASNVQHVLPQPPHWRPLVSPMYVRSYITTPCASRTFTKCWGNAILQPMYYQASQTPGNVLNTFNQPPFRNCHAWVVVRCPTISLEWSWVCRV